MIYYIMIDDGDHKEVCRYSNTEMVELFTTVQIKLMRDGKVVTCSKSQGNDWMRAGTTTKACDMGVIVSRHMDFINGK